LAELVGGEVAHVPTVLPDAIVQIPVQHWALEEQTSPPCKQNDEGWQAPLTQRPEQQSVPLVHAFPRVLHPLGPLIGAHVPPVHVWLQQ
jgi:hypothetical protein